MIDTPKPKLEVKNLSVAYQTRTELVDALVGVSFRVPQSGSVGLWGHSGCGKSTAMKAILGLPIDGPGWIEGEAFLNGERISPEVRDFVSISSTGVVRKDIVGFYYDHQKRLRPHLGTAIRSIFQEPIYSFDSERSVGFQAANFLEFLARRSSNGYAGKELVDEFESALAFLNLDMSYIQNRQNLQLSGGECQRVLLAMNLVGRPQLLFADEPTTAMDQDTRIRANALVNQKIDTHGMALLISSHNREELLALTHHVVVLCKGIVVEQMSRRYLSESPNESLHPYTRKLWYSVGDRDPLPAHKGSAMEGKSETCPFWEECPYPLKDKRLEKLCSSEMPPSFEAGTEHEVSCWLHRSSHESGAESKDA